MDIINMLLFCAMSLIIGAVLMLLIQYYAFIKYCNLPANDDRRKTFEEKYHLPEDILAAIAGAGEPQNNDSATNNDPTKNSTLAVNLILQFLFFELRHSNKVRKWFYRKLSLELDELITKTTIGKLFDKLSICDLDLGSQFPEIKTIKVHSVELHPDEGHIENLDIILNLNYHGNFTLSIDADMVLGKKGYLSVKVKQISGLARLQFTRKPYTHWSLCFLGDPQIDLGVRSQFQGRQMQSNVTSLISNQIRKAIRRKHTLPNYKLRYKPFFHRVEDDQDTSDIIPDGLLEIRVKEITRINTPVHLKNLYCVLTIASIPWVLAKQHDDRNLIISLDIEIHKAKNQQIGIVFKQNENTVLVEAVIPNTPAAKARLMKGDVLISIEGKKVSHINHVAKIIKSLNRPMFQMRIERLVSGIIKNDAILEDYELNEDFSNDTLNISFSKSSDSVQITKTSSSIARKNSIDKVAPIDSSLGNSPSSSPSKKPPIPALKLKNLIGRKNSENEAPASDGSKTQIPAYIVLSDNNGIPSTVECFQQHSTVDCGINSFIRMDDLSTFKLNDNSLFLNLNVFGRYADDVMLLGHLNLPIKNILYECSESNVGGQFMKQYPLTPPDTPNLSQHVLSSQSGFDPELCFGDILLSFTSIGSTALRSSTATFLGDTKKSKTGSTEVLEDDKMYEPTIVSQKAHNFVRTHFHRSTQCDFCGKKIWLKDAVQCRDCAMCCHKKCVTKCQTSTICGPAELTTASQPELKITEPQLMDGEELEEADEVSPKLDQHNGNHRQSFSDLLVQGIKRVNSANNLAIPGIVSSLSQSSRSLPPSPQHTPRKQSLAHISASNPFITIPSILDQFPDTINDLTKEQITELVEPIIGWGSPDDLMTLAKTTSRNLYVELDVDARVERINNLLAKLRLALDSETLEHANLESNRFATERNSIPSAVNDNNIQISCDTTIILQTKGPSSPVNSVSSSSTSSAIQLSSPTTSLNNEPINNHSNSRANNTTNKTSIEHEQARRAILLGQSEERVQALSIIMLHLCSALQYAQGVAGQ